MLYYYRYSFFSFLNYNPILPLFGCEFTHPELFCLFYFCNIYFLFLFYSVNLSFSERTNDRSETATPEIIPIRNLQPYSHPFTSSNMSYHQVICPFNFAGDNSTAPPPHSRIHFIVDNFILL